MGLRELREAMPDPESGRKVSGERIAQLIGVSVMSYYAWERGTLLPSGENMFKLEKILPGSINALMNMYDERQQVGS